MFVILLEYIKPLETIEALLPAHRDYLDRGVILARPIDRAQLESILAEDPFQREVAATYRIVEFTPSKFAPATESLFSAN